MRALLAARSFLMLLCGRSYISDLNSIFTLREEQKLCRRLFSVETLFCLLASIHLSASAV